MVHPISKMRLPAWVYGAIFGVVNWVLALFGAYGFKAGRSWFPGWMEEFDLVDTVGSMFMIIAAPVAAGGWLMIWGDGRQPPLWLTSVTFNIGFAICFYAVLGGFIGLLFSRKWPDRFTRLKLLIVVTVVILIVGIVPLLREQLD